MGENPNLYCNGNAGFVSYSGVNSESYSLVRVGIITRHGDRTPVNGNVWPINIMDNVVWNCSLNLLVAQGFEGGLGYPNRVFEKHYIRGREVLPGNCMLGQLTQKGATQHQTLGKSFRARYVTELGFLPSSFDPTYVKVRSTDVERTLLSAYNFLEGLYPSASGSSPIVQVDTIDDQMDNAWPNPELCPALTKQYQQTESSSQYLKFYAINVQPLATKYGALWGVNLTSSNMRSLNDIVRSRYCHGLAMPPHMTMEDAELLMYATRYLDNLVSAPLQTLQFSSGLFLGDVYAFLAKTTTPQKLQLFSAHDDTLRCLLLSLIDGANDEIHWPPYAAHITFELWQQKKQGSKFIVAQYDGKVAQLAAPCRTPLCALSDFYKLISKYQFNFDKCFE